MTIIDIKVNSTKLRTDTGKSKHSINKATTNMYSEYLIISLVRKSERPI